MTIYMELGAICRRQHGLITARQLAGLGCTPVLIRRLCITGHLTHLRRGVYRACGVSPSWESVALAAVLAAGDGAVLSHRSAGVLWGLLDRHQETAALEIITPGRRHLDGVVVHCQELASRERTVRRDIPVTTAERTLFDLAQTMTDAELGRLCDEALRRRIVTLGRLHGVVAAHGGRGRRRLAPIHTVLADRIAGYDPGANDWERRMDRMWDRCGLPPAERQYRIPVGRRTYRADRAIVDLKIAIESTGYDPHGYRASFDSDSDRRSALAAAGWYPLDFTSRSSPKIICTTVLAVVAERRRLFGIAS